MKFPSLFLILLPLMIITSSCSKDDEQQSSSQGSSHNTGRNCLSCHSFKVAGSVYSSDFSTTLKGATVILTTEANGGGSTVGTYTTDQTGNFYTNSSVSFGDGLFVGVKAANGTYTYMASAITSGACNSCHSGSGTDKIFAE